MRRLSARATLATSLSARARRAALAGFAALAAFAPLVGSAALGGCAVFGGNGIPSKLDAARVPAAIETARADLAAGRTETALDWMRAAAGASGLSTELRDEVQRLLEEAAARRIDELSQPGRDPEELAEMLDLGLPRQLAVTAGIRAARRMYEQGDRMDAFGVIKKIDARFPLHHERVAAGDLLADIGFDLAADRSSFLGLFHKTDDAQEVLEYLVLEAPWCSRCDEAFVALADLYEKEREIPLAIERLEQLVLDHPTSPLRVASEARIPRLRLDALKSPEYDRAELRRARGELERWLRTHAGHELETGVRLELADCLVRLAENDLVIARFYRRVDNAAGARHHAARAVDEARSAGDEERARAAEAFLASLPPSDSAKPPPEAPPPVDLPPDPAVDPPPGGAGGAP